MREEREWINYVFGGWWTEGVRTEGYMTRTSPVDWHSSGEDELAVNVGFSAGHQGQGSLNCGGSADRQSLETSMRAWEMSIRRFTGLLVTSGTVILGGYGLMLLVTPTDEQIKAVASPKIGANERECRPKCGENLTLRNTKDWNVKRNYSNI